jgi:RNA polymerase sporulation-specific sigma factor
MDNTEQNTLLEAARMGDEVALAELIVQHMASIRALAHTVQQPGLAFDDAVQEGMIGLLQAVKSYNAAKGASFATYAGVCIEHAMVSAARAAGRRKHTPLNQAVSYNALDEADYAAQAAEPNPEEQVLANEQMSQVMTDIRTRLSVRERQVLALFLDGLSYSAIAARLSIDEKAVDNALQRVRAKLR